MAIKEFDKKAEEGKQDQIQSKGRMLSIAYGETYKVY